MGYELHITRRRDWADEQGPGIAESEWRAFVASSEDLRLESVGDDLFAIWKNASVLPEQWLQWDNGNLSTKNPDERFIARMVEIASALGAAVQGDDGEVYGPHAEEHAPSKRQRLLQRVLEFFRKLFRRRVRPRPGFSVGDRVTDVFGRPGVIRDIDLSAEHGLGLIEVEYENGAVRSYAAMSSGLQLRRE